MPALMIVIEGAAIQSVVSHDPLLIGTTVYALDYDADEDPASADILVTQADGTRAPAYYTARTVQESAIYLPEGAQPRQIDPVAPTAPEAGAKRDLSTVSDNALLDELRKRGNAVAIYNVEEIMAMVDGCAGAPSEETVREWFDALDVEEVMCDAVRRAVDRLPADEDEDEDE